MAEFLDVKYKHWHTLLINIILFSIIIVIYYSLKTYPKIVENPGSFSICLLGSYIGLNTILTFGHEFYHSHTEKKNSVHPEKKTS
jgi:hypothetical protein